MLGADDLAGRPHNLQFEGGFADVDGHPDPDMPISIIRVTLDEQPDGGTQMTIETIFPTVEAMEQMMAMGIQEGMTLAVGQIDGLLQADVSAP